MMAATRDLSIHIDLSASEVKRIDFKTADGPLPKVSIASVSAALTALKTSSADA